MPLTASHRQRDDRRTVDTARTASGYSVLQGRIRRGSVNLRPKRVQTRSGKRRHAKHAAATAWSDGTALVGIGLVLARMAMSRNLSRTMVVLLWLDGAMVIVCQAVGGRAFGKRERERRRDGANAKQNGEHQRCLYPDRSRHSNQHYGLSPTLCRLLTARHQEYRNAKLTAS